MTLPENQNFKPELPKFLKRIAEDIREAGGKSFLVGGWVRDTLIGNDCRDYDVEVYHMPEETLLKILSRYGKPNLVGKAFGVILLSVKGVTYDFSFPRTESKVGKGHRGFIVNTHQDISFREAAARRDFTINAMGMELPHLELCDPYRGREDLQNRILRHVSAAFVEDSLRVLRGVQFASRFELTLAEETAALCRTLSLEDLSKERLFEEFKKWMLKPGKLSMGLKAFREMELGKFFPEIRPLNNSWENLGKSLDYLSKSTAELPESSRTILLFTMLLFGAENKEKILLFLERLTNESELLQKVPLLWELSRKVILQGEENDWNFNPEFLRRESLVLSGFSLVTEFLKALPSPDFAASEKKADRLRESAEKSEVLYQALESFIGGKDLMALGVKPGKVFGEIIRECLELQITGALTTREQALQWLKTRLTSI
ncbi:MAG: CCA tRNA nucleotidyltransferase [Fibrobacter sp.]|jgi:tRNA nucleotidyltransferase (CCA-adding enzyme)|nr:CCA tRNA nucleotidyltransferase [Fibrobacter sp.]